MCHQTAIETNGDFAAKIRRVIELARPRRLIETGTHLGRGSTAVIVDAMAPDAKLYSIEVNPSHFREASGLYASDARVQILNGLSTPRGLLPTDARTFEMARAAKEAQVFVDGNVEAAANFYGREVDFPELPDNLLGVAFDKCLGAPDFVMLDSAGHIGFIEFEHLMTLVRGPFVLVLDDIFHMKHYRSFVATQRNPRFEIIAQGHERYGYLIARYR